MQGLFMKIYLLKDIEGVGIAGEIVKVKEGYADNFLLPRKMGIKVTTKNAPFYEERAKHIEHRKDVISSKTSMLAEKIKTMKLTIKRKMHDDGKLYASVNPAEVADLLAKAGVNVSKSQVKIDKAIKEKGNFDVTIKLTSQLQTKVQLKVISEVSKAV
jgi:large subunit ribosomal protein L9